MGRLEAWRPAAKGCQLATRKQPRAQGLARNSSVQATRMHNSAHEYARAEEPYKLMSTIGATESWGLIAVSALRFGNVLISFTFLLSRFEKSHMRVSRVRQL